MDELSSTEFRRTYAKLQRITMVTANGHVIGTWMPISTAVMVPSEEEQAAYRADRLANGADPMRGFNTRPFTPVPKGRR